MKLNLVFLLSYHVDHSTLHQIYLWSWSNPEAEHLWTKIPTSEPKVI